MEYVATTLTGPPRYFIPLLFLWVLSMTSVTDCKTPIYIAGLFPMSPGRRGDVGRGVLPAAQLAIEHVNSHPTVLEDYELKLNWSDSKCDMAVGTKLFFDMMFNWPPKIVLFGDSCSEVTQPIAESTKYFDILQVSYADNNPLLSSRSTYPNFFRTIPSEADFNLARMAFLKEFNWTRVGTLYQDASSGDSRYANGHSKLLTVLERNDVDTTTQSFANDPHSAVSVLKNEDIRIILGNFDHVMARKVFCAAYHHRLYGEKYVWILLGGYPDTWWQTLDPSANCTREQLAESINGYFATDVLPISTEDTMTVANITAGNYLSLYNQLRGQNFSKYHGYAYDGVWAIAMAINGTLGNSSSRHLLNETHVLPQRQFFSALNKTGFQGVTGYVHLSLGDRVGLIEMQQFQRGAVVKIGEYDVGRSHLNLSRGLPVAWMGDDGRPPLDSRLKVLQSLELGIYCAIVILSGCGVVMACIFLAINIHFRNHVHIKMSSPNMNNLIIVGCLITYSAVMLLGADSELIGQQVFPKMCASRAWLLGVGFSISFGAMFCKTWRVYSIFSNVNVNKKVIKDWMLFLAVGVLVLLDVVFLTTWQIVDPFQRNISYQQPVVDTVTEREYIPVLEFCVSNHTTVWLSVIYSYKGVLLLCGCFLAWETRNVSIPALNDSKYIGMSVYNVVIMCLSGAVISFILTDKPTAAFVIISIFIIFCTTLTLCLVFVPKVIQIRKDPKGEHKRVRAVFGKKKSKPSSQPSEMADEFKLKRTENTEYRTILAEKNAELLELQEQLGDSVSDTSSVSSAHKSSLGLRSVKFTRVPSASNSSNGGTCIYYAETCSVCSGSSGSSQDTRLASMLPMSPELESTDATSMCELCNSRALTHPVSIQFGHSTEYGSVYLGDSTSVTRTLQRPHSDGLNMNITFAEFSTLRETDILYDDKSEETEEMSGRSLIKTPFSNTNGYAPMFPKDKNSVSSMLIHNKNPDVCTSDQKDEEYEQTPIVVLSTTQKILKHLEMKLELLDDDEKQLSDVKADNNNEDVESQWRINFADDNMGSTCKKRELDREQSGCLYSQCDRSETVAKWVKNSSSCHTKPICDIIATI